MQRFLCMKWVEQKHFMQGLKCWTSRKAERTECFSIHQNALGKSLFAYLIKINDFTHKFNSLELETADVCMLKESGEFEGGRLKKQANWKDMLQHRWSDQSINTIKTRCNRMQSCTIFSMSSQQYYSIWYSPALSPLGHCHQFQMNFQLPKKIYAGNLH